IAMMDRGYAETKQQRIQSPSSIPTKYQTMVIRNEEKKGFSSQTKRFPSLLCLNDNPGPGSYDCISRADIKNPSFSKKGTTGFTAKGYRNPQRATPAPNVYNLQSSFLHKYDFNNGVSRVFRLPVAVQLDGPKYQTPAPNQYDVCIQFLISSVVGTSVFLSKTQRDSFYSDKNVPSPCHYEVNDNLIQRSSKAVLSPFCSKTLRIPVPVNNHVPGPGAYNPHQPPAPVKKTILPRGYNSARAAPPLIVPKDLPSPGPGQYNIGSYDGTSKNPMPTAAFASRTERLPQHSRADMRPGPGFYDPRILSKQSFFYNNSRVWIPA
uniref:Sperm-tail PG-rich repeat containing 1 n=1 Tax=Echeneis naucrates TaxID=173247 RepID=A0A665W7A1_ECHNA